MKLMSAHRLAAALVCLHLLIPAKSLAEEKVPLQWIEPDLLMDAYPRYRRVYSNYQPKDSVVQQIADIEGAVEVLAFYGTWCRDSRREVPRLLKVAAELGETADFYVQLIPVNESRERLDAGRQVSIAKTPTLVVYINGGEVGRIEERAEPDTERALLKILKERKFRGSAAKYPGAAKKQ